MPPTISPDEMKKLPPGMQQEYQQNPGMPPAQNDFPLEASITPTKGDPGTPTTISATAVGQPGSLIVIVAHFFDGKHHGMRAAKVTDVTGHTVFDGPIPKDAPKGLAYIYVSASSKTRKSALKSLKFIVTGPGCP